MSKLSFALPLALLLGSALPLSAQSPQAITPNVTIAFLGDQGLGGDATAVLALIRDEGADAVIHSGDFDYQGDPAAWEAQIDAVLGPDFPYFASVGNHDEGEFYDPGGYQDRLEARMNRLGIPWVGDLGVRSSFHFEGIFIVFTAPGSYGNGDAVYAPYIRDALAADASAWSISAWHKNMRRMQVGGKSNETGWGVYEESRRGGAIIATAHEHTYSRTHLLSNFPNQVVASTGSPLVLAADDPATPEDEGRSFAFVSGLGGKSIRNQEIGGPWWASVYTSDQGARSGALFGVFNYDGDPNLARFVFKDLGGQVIDDFFVTSSLVPAPTALRISDVAVVEGDSGSSEAQLRVTLSGASGGEVAVDYATLDGSATAATDYAAGSGRLVFSGNLTEQDLSVSVWGDGSVEGDESFFVELAAPDGAIVTRPLGEVVILDDDGPPATLLLSVDTQGPGLVALDPPGGLYPPGTQVQLTAVAAPGHAFAGWGGALAGTLNPATLVLDQARQVTAHFSAVEASLLQVESGSAANKSVVSTAAPLVAADDQLYLAAIAYRSEVAVTGVSGLGLAWTPVRAQCSGRGQTGVALWQARGAPTSSGVVTATFAQAPAYSVLAVSRYGGVGAIDPLRAKSANSVGVSGACTGGSDGVSYAVGLETAAASSLLYVAAAPRSRDHLPGSGFVERAKLVAGDAGNATGLSVADSQAGAPGPVLVGGGFSGDVDWGVVAAEIPVATPFTLDVLPSAGGTIALDPPFGAYLAGSPVTLTALPEEGYRFGGWSGDLAGAQNPALVVMDSDKSVGAAFLPQVRVDLLPASGGSITLDPPGGLYDPGTSVTLTALPGARHRFTGWGGALGGMQNPATLVVGANALVSAGFVQTFDLNVSASSGGSVTLAPASGPYDDGSSITLTAFPDAGYRFVGWSGVLSGAGNPGVLVIEADETIQATFLPLPTLSVSSTGGGSVTLAPPGGTYAVGTQVALTAFPEPLHRFTGWSGALSGAANPTSIVVDADRSVGASFVRQFTLGASPAAGGSVAFDPPGGVYDQGASVTVIAVPDPRHRFTGWSGALSGAANPTSIVVGADGTVGASFFPQAALALTPSAGGFVGLDPPGGLYDLGTVVTLTATPRTGGIFARWEGDLSGMTNPTSVLVDRDLQVGALFVAPVALRQLVSGASSSSSNVSTEAALAAADGHLYLAAIAFKPNVAVSGVSGLGLVWSPVRHQCAGRGQTGLSLWQARGDASVDGVVTATLAANADNAVIAVSRYEHADALAAAGAVSANSVGVGGACSGGQDQDAYAFALSTTTPGGLLYAATAMRNREHVAGSGYQERLERHKGSGGSIAGLSLADLRIGAPGPTAVLGSYSGQTDWATIALEIPASPFVKRITRRHAH